MWSWLDEFTVLIHFLSNLTIVDIDWVDWVMQSPDGVTPARSTTPRKLPVKTHCGGAGFELRSTQISWGVSHSAVLLYQ